MIDLAYQPPPLGFPDRSGRFVAVGVVLLVMAAVAGLMTAVIVWVQILQSRLGVQSPPGQLAFGVGMYGGAAVALAWVGVGALLKRRWVRPVTLVLASIWAIGGATAVAFLVVGTAVAVAARGGAMAGGAGLSVVLIGMAIGMGFVAVLLVVVPLVLLWLVRPDDVRRTAEHYDLRPRWTDGVPVKLLGGVFTLAVLAAFQVLAAIDPHLLLFGTILAGWTARALLLVIAVPLAWAAWRLFRGDLRGWWAGLGLVIVPSLAYLPSIFGPATMTPEQIAALPPEFVAITQRHAVGLRALSLAILVLFDGLFVLYMLRLRPLLAEVRRPGSE